ncbi:MAG TPA: hypothetical protein VF299_11140 [Mycobacterium sp.]
MDTVLGLSLTPTAVGWVLVDGSDADGPTLVREEVTGAVRDGGTGATSLADATTAALQLQTMVEARGQRLRGIGVTWSADAAVEAALLLESLTEAGFDNVVPVRFPNAAESLVHGLPQGKAKIAESERTAVCVIHPGLATVVMVDGETSGDPTTAQHEFTDDDDLVGWLTRLFAPGNWRPGALVLALTGSRAGLDALAVRLEAALGLPVFVRAGARLGLARGAARALGPSTEFTDVHPDDMDGVTAGAKAGSWSVPYAGALTVLVAGVLTFVVSSAAAVSLQLSSAGEATPPAVAEAAKAAPTKIATPESAPERSPAQARRAPAVLGSAWEEVRLADEVAPAPPGSAVPSSGPSGSHRSLLSRVLDHLPHLHGH